MAFPPDTGTDACETEGTTNNSKTNDKQSCGWTALFSGLSSATYKQADATGKK